MKKLLLIPSLMILTLASFAQQGVWVSKASGFGAQSSGIREIYPVDANVIWAISYDGTGANLFRSDYTRSIDGGDTWTAAYIPTDSFTYDWANICAINADTAWALLFDHISNNGGQLWKTTDGGSNWSQIGQNIFNSTTTGFPNNVYFWDANEGVILGDPDSTGEFEIQRTMDGGANWTRVAGVDIPDTLDDLEAAWTNHYQVIGDTVWFDTNEGRVFRSVDRGLHWTASHTTLAIVPASTPEQALDICFTSGSYGIARYYDDATKTSWTVNTTDGGMTWDSIVYAGNFYGGDVEAIPGTNTMVSTGISNTSNYTGSSYSTDGGLTWTTIENGVQRGALGIADSLNMWCGGFSFTPAQDGIFKWEIVPTIPCNDPSINPGAAIGNDTSACDGESILFQVSGFTGPEDGYYSGVSWVISNIDITGSTDPIPSTLFVTRLIIPAIGNTDLLFTNDGSLIDGTTFPYGQYFATPVFFGNATVTDTTAPLSNFNNLTLDPTCTFAGNSVPFTFYAPNDINCAVGISEVSNGQLSMNSFMRDANTLQLNITSVNGGKAFIQLMDLTGRTVYNNSTTVNNGSNQKTINVSDLANGTYIVKAIVNGNVVTGKVVKY